MDKKIAKEISKLSKLLDKMIVIIDHMEMLLGEAKEEGEDTHCCYH